MSNKYLINHYKHKLGTIRIIFYALAFITLIAARFVRNLVLSNKAQLILPAQAVQQPVLQRYQSATIVSLAMSKAIGIYGLLLFFLGKNYVDLYLMIIISAVAMFMYRPNKLDFTDLMSSGLKVHR